MEIKIVSGIAEQLCGDGGGGGGAPLETRYWGGTKNLFLLLLYHSKNIGMGGGGGPASPALRSLSFKNRAAENFQTWKSYALCHENSLQAIFL